MKILLLSLFLYSLTSIVAQDWTPISTSIKSVFIKSQLPSPLACFSIDSVNQISNDSVIYYNYQLYGDNNNQTTDYSSCTWTLGPGCHIIQNTMSWLGHKIINTNNSWFFITNNNDSLKFDFNNSDTSIVFQNNDKILKLYHTNSSIQNLFGTLDSIKEYDILQYDASGILIQDELLNKTIRLSKHYGLLDFIEVRDYPTSIGFYSLRGSSNSNDTIGEVTIKEYELHQSEVGTITQFENKRATYYTCCPTEHPGYYSLETYETIGSTFSGSSYIMTQSSNNAIIDTIIIDTNLVAYQIPFIRNIANQRITVTIDSTQCYGEGFYVLTSYIDCEAFCPLYNCYSGIELTAPYCIEFYVKKKPNTKEVLFEYGLGAPSFPPQSQHNLIYTLVNGVSCGTRAFASINDLNKKKQIVFPNPVNSELFIKGVNSEVQSIVIRDLNGKVIKNLLTHDKTIDVSSLTNGAYFIEVETLETIIVNTFIKE